MIADVCMKKTKSYQVNDFYMIINKKFLNVNVYIK